MIEFCREIPRLDGRRVTVMGLGLFGGGVGATRYLLRRGAHVTVTDLRSEEELRESVQALSGADIQWRLGGHFEEDFRGSDLVLVNPAVRPDSPFLRLAPRLETEMNLFWKLCRSRWIVGVTGSNGKTTTTVLVGEILRRSEGRVFVGGNLGGSLLEEVEEIGPEDRVVLELSSFQLENLAVLGRSPRVAAVLNLTPNHLDRHGTMEAYVAAKRRIVADQVAGDVKILNGEDALVRSFSPAAPSRTAFFGLDGPISEGAWSEDERLQFSIGQDRFETSVAGRRILGRFNLQNMLAAGLAAAHATAGPLAGWRDAAEEVFRTFPGVEHRLEFVQEKGGVKFYNDSIATSPESTIAALETLPGPIILLAGGYDKKLPLEALGDKIAERVRALVVLGATGPRIAELVEGRGPKVIRAASLEEAVALASAAARPGDTVLLSPACASWDMFRNFEERGRLFRERVHGAGIHV